jgi:hypothetical protein
VATGPDAGEDFDCPPWIPNSSPRQSPVRQPDPYIGRILRSHEDKTTAEVHDYLDERTGVLAATLARHASGYTGLGFPDPRKLALTPSASTGS